MNHSVPREFPEHDSSCVNVVNYLHRKREIIRVLIPGMGYMHMGITSKSNSPSWDVTQPGAVCDSATLPDHNGLFYGSRSAKA